jgi:hypothetical protein
MTEPTMKEKKELIKNTYLAHTHSDEGGRFAKTTPTNVIGSSPVSYPKLRTGPWADQPMPPEEPPLGFSVEEVPVVGESWEVEASLDRNFGLQRSLAEGAPTSASDASSPPDAVGVGAVAPPDPTVDNSSIVDRPGIVPLPMSGESKHGKGDCPDVLFSPKNSKSQPQRRLR